MDNWNVIKSFSVQREKDLSGIIQGVSDKQMLIRVFHPSMIKDIDIKIILQKKFMQLSLSM